MADDRKVSVVVQTSQALSSLTKIGIAMDDFGASTGKTDRELRQLDRIIVQSQKDIAKAERALFNANVELKRFGTEATTSNNTIRSLENRLGTANKRIAEYKVKLEEARKANGLLAKDNANLSSQLDKTAVSAANAGNKIAKSGKQTRDALEDLNHGFQENALRYALYDVANSFGVLRDAGVAAFSDLINTSMEFERSFANVIRTSQVSNGDLFADPIRATALLREQFLDLQSTLPVTADDLSKIGTLAAQMGIAADKVAGFTEVTAKFAAASGVGAEEAATALARIGQILSDDVKDDYERLASAILKTGVNAIATEQQIVRGTNQIASIGKVAGLSAQEIIALSSAMSSLGMSPELQRSVITSSFTKILTAVRGSSDEAAKFGEILGMTGKEFQSAWEGDGYNTYRKLLTTISNSPDAIGILQDLGLASQRLTPNLLKLGQSYGLLGQTLKDTNQGWSEDAELQRQYQVIMDTTAAKLQVLQQAWDAFLTVIGAPIVSSLGNVFAGITTAINQLRKAMGNPIVSTIVQLVLALGLIVTGALAILTAFTLAGAAFLGFRYVVEQLGVALPAVQTKLAALGLQTTTFTGQTRAATLAAKAFGIALKAATLVGLVLVAPDALRALSDFADKAHGVDTTIKGLADTVQKGFGGSFGDGLLIFNSVKDLPDWVAAIDRAAGPIGGSGAFFKAIGQLDEKLRDLANSGQAEKAAAQLKVLREQFKKEGGSDSAFEALFVDTYDALKLVSNQADATSEEMQSYYDGLDNEANAEANATIRSASLAEALGLVAAAGGDAEQALKDYAAAFQSGASQFFDINDLLDNAYGTEDGQGGGLQRLTDDLNASLTNAHTWADGLAQLAQRGAGNLSQAFASAGPASQQAITEALALGPEALAALEQSFADAAFFASQAYADAFANDNALLADVYKKALAVDPNTALDAVHAIRDALNAGADEAAIAAISAQFGIDFNINLVPELDPEAYTIAQAALAAKPIQVPAEFAIGPLAETVPAWQVELDGHTLIIPVDPKTDEGKKIIQEWRDSEYATPLSIQTWADTVGADLAMEQWRLAQQSRVLDIIVRSNLPDKNGAESGNGYFGTFKTGGMVKDGKAFHNNYPKYATGRGPILRGPGTGTSDSILARVSNGEAITRARAVRHYGTKFFEDVNNLRLPRYATGFTPTMGPATAGRGRGAGTNIEVNMINPVTRDPLKQLRKSSEFIAAGLWGDD